MKVGESGAPDHSRRSYVKDIVEHMFLGRYQHSVDNKGRLTIPARYRDLLAADGAYVTQGFEDNLIVYTTPAFERIYQGINQMSMTNPMSRILRRLMFSGAERVDVDRAGRILIPQFLREFARLEDQAVVVGAGDYFEIWSPDLWQEQTAQLQDAHSNAQRFMDLDLSPSL